MADETDKKKCKNSTCGCPAADDGDYCSANCEGARDITQIDCDCGHPACGGDF